MSKPLFFAIAAAVMFAAVASFSLAQSAPSSEDKALRAIVQTLQDGWNAGDSAKFASVFASDADYVVVNGQHVRTRQAIDFGHKQIFGTIYKGSKNNGIVKQIRMLRPDVAVIHVEWTLLFGEKLENKGHAMNTIVALKNGNKWEIATFQNTPIMDFGG